MRRPELAMLLGLALPLVAPGAAAHGQSIEVAQDVPPYHVIFYTYDSLSAGELVRLAWNVTDAASQQLVEVPNATLTKEDRDATDAAVNRTTIPLQQRAAGFLFADVQMGPEGRAVLTVTLPPGGARPTATFEACVYPASTPPGGLAARHPEDRCAPVAANAPLPASLALAALAGAAFAGRRR